MDCWLHFENISFSAPSDEARVSPEGGSLGQGSFEEGQQSNIIPSKSIKYAKSPTSRGGGARMSRGGQSPPPRWLRPCAHVTKNAAIIGSRKWALLVIARLYRGGGPGGPDPPLSRPKVTLETI